MQSSIQKIHWNYFLALERDLETISRYVELSEKNYSTYSIAIAHLLMASSSETDVVLKSICDKIDNNTEHRTISSYHDIISKKCHSMLEYTVYIPRYGIEIIPWRGWTHESSPQWWKDNNSVKHKRDTNFEKATLHNALYSMSALFVATIEYYKINHENYETQKYAMKELMGSLAPESSLLRLHEDNYLNLVYSY